MDVSSLNIANRTDMPTGKLQLLCVGTGRDGTTSVSEMIQHVFDSEGQGRIVGHEWQSVELYNAFCLYCEQQDTRHFSTIREIISTCPYNCVVGNGYQPMLDIFREIYGSDLVLIHLKRRDKESCIRSLIENCLQHPTNHKYYSPDPGASGRRMAAFHFGDMSSKEWQRISLHDRFSWYYDKTHELVEKASKKFPYSYDVITEELDSVETRKTLSSAAGSAIIARRVSLNRHFGFSEYSVEERLWLQRSLGKLDADLLAKDPSYGLSHFSAEFIRQISDWMLSSDEGRVQRTSEQFRKATETFQYFSNALNSLGLRLQEPVVLEKGSSALKRIENTLWAEKFDLARARDDALAARDEALVQQDRISKEYREMLLERDKALGERDEAWAQQKRLAAERHAMAQERDKALTERDEAWAKLAQSRDPGK